MNLRWLPAVLWGLLVFSPAAGAQDLRAGANDKCGRYRQATEDGLARWGRQGLGEDFLAAHRQFIEGGCQGPPGICPRPGAETNFANAMTVRALGAGMASTFLPWACR